MPEVVPDELAEAVLGFVRAFGLHRGESTPCGVPISVSEAHALIELSDGPIGQTELVRRLGLTKSTVSRLVTVLEERGWMHRLADAVDGRATRIVLTDEGERATARLARARRERFGVLLDAIPTQERAHVLHGLATLATAARSTDPRHA